MLAALSAAPARAACLYTLNFGFDQVVLTPEASAILDQIAQRFPNGPLIVRGHTDLVGSAASNLALSQRRVDAVTARLGADGVTVGSFQRTEAVGQTQPLIDTPDREPRNRRVEITTPSCIAQAAPAAAAGGALGPIAVPAIAGLGILGIGLLVGGSGTPTTATASSGTSR
ncbi:MAG: OmpA family protein [Gemmobacter sp.]